MCVCVSVSDPRDPGPWLGRLNSRKQHLSWDGLALPFATSSLLREIGSMPIPSWITGGYCGMAPTWLWWPPSLPVDSASCHIPVVVLAKASTSPRRTASPLAMVRHPWAKPWDSVGTEEDGAQCLPSSWGLLKRNPERLLTRVLCAASWGLGDPELQLPREGHAMQIVPTRPGKEVKEEPSR